MARPLPGLSAAWRALGWLDAVTVQVRYFRAGRRSRLYSLGAEVTDLDAIASADATDSARLVFGAASPPGHCRGFRSDVPRGRRRRCTLKLLPVEPPGRRFGGDADPLPRARVHDRKRRVPLDVIALELSLNL